ncbi:MAG: hypothetical protein ACPGYV_06975 [Phycisphaeraceae bacterium]
MKLIVTYLIALVVQLSVAAALYTQFRTKRHHLEGEDELVEHASAGFFFLTFALASWMLARPAAVRKRMLLFLAGFGLLGFLDEISFGERIFDYEPHELFGVRIDAAHDLIEVVPPLIAYTSPWSWVVLAAIGLGVAAWGVVRRARVVAFVDSARRDPVYVCLSACAALGVGSVLLDLRAFSFDMFRVTEELFEMNAALALVLACFYLFAESKKKVQSPATPATHLAEKDRRESVHEFPRVHEGSAA